MAKRRALGWLVGALGLAWCGWASAFRAGTVGGKFTWLVSLALVLLAALAVYLGRSGNRLGWHIEPGPPSWPRPGPVAVRGELIGIAPWLALGVLVLAWEILGIDTGRHEPHMTISALTLAFRSMRAATLAVWMGVGVCFAVARAHASLPASRASHGNPDDAPRAASLLGAAFGTGRMARHVVSLLALLEGGSRAVGVSFWMGVVVCAAGIELAAGRSAGRIARFDDVLRFISGPVAARIIIVVAWTYAGWHLFAH